MDLSILRKFGLNTNDIKVYKAMLGLGQTKTGLISKRAGVVSSRVYDSLNNLAKYGLVSYQVENNIRYYKAENPDQLFDELIENEKALIQLSKAVKDLPILKNERNEANIYLGKRGFKKAAAEHFEKCSKGEEIYMMGWSSRVVDFRELVDFYTKIDHEIMVKKNIKARLLLDIKYKNVAKRKTKFKNYQVRFIPAGYFSPIGINISNQEVLLDVWSEQPIVFAIYNSVVIESFKKQFEYLWSRAKEE